MFKIVRSWHDTQTHFAMIVTDQGTFPEPFQSLSSPANSCEEYGGYNEYVAVKCLDSEEFMQMLVQVPTFNREL